MGRLWITIQEQNPAGFAQMLKKTGKQVKQHNCQLNHTASSKAMEPMAAVHLFTESLNFKCRRAQLHKQKLNLDGKKQAKEGNTYQSGIGLNLDPNNST